MPVYSENIVSNNNVEIKPLDLKNKDNLFKLLVLVKKEMPECFSGVRLYLAMNKYDKIMGAFDKKTNTLIGAGLLLDKNKINKNLVVENKLEDLKKTAVLDSLIVDKKHTHKKVASLLLNEIYDYCNNNNFKLLELYCPFETGRKTNVYDKNDFSRVAVAGQNNTPKYFVFKANTNRKVRDFSKVLFASMLECYDKKIVDVNKYMRVLKKGKISKKFLKISNINVAKFKEITKSKEFKNFKNIFEEVVYNKENLQTTSAILKQSMLKQTFSKQENEEIKPYKKVKQSMFSKNKMVEHSISILDGKEIPIENLSFMDEVVDETLKKVSNVKYINKYR